VDTFNGNASETPGVIGRIGLHAWQLAFTHPLSGETLSFMAPQPVVFSAAIGKLRVSQI
jgi:23S rRNA-/tRNA-specific pseudouridylate synthase